MPYRNVYEEKKAVERDLETDPKKIEQLYRSQIPYLPNTSEFENRRKKITRSNLAVRKGEVNSAEDGRCDRGIKRSILER